MPGAVFASEHMQQQCRWVDPVTDTSLFTDADADERKRTEEHASRPELHFTRVLVLRSVHIPLRTNPGNHAFSGCKVTGRLEGHRGLRKPGQQACGRTTLRGGSVGSHHLET